MPRKSVFSRQDVIQAAYDLVEEHGLHRLSARTVADRLQSSTAPVYTNFQTMNDLIREVLRLGKDLLLVYATRPHTERIFLNMGIGVIKYARDHSNMYRALFLESGAYKDLLNDLRASLLPVLDRDERLSCLSQPQKDDLLTKMSIITHGIAAQVCIGLIDVHGNENIGETLQSVGASVVTAAIAEAQGKNSFH